MITVGRHEHGICLNDYEYILNEDGSIMEFSTKEAAVEFLNSKVRLDFTIHQWVDQGVYFFEDGELI
jgi:hypothetical protein